MRVQVKARAQRRGAAVIEFAVCAPLLFLLILGMFEVGRYINVGEVATQASRYGARQATVANATLSSVSTQVNNYLDASGVKSAAATIKLEAETAVGNSTFAVVSDLSTVTTGSAIRVTVEVDFPQVTWVPGGFFRNVLPAKIPAVTVMRKESA
jgi:Flp pilus assembly protein TadG